MDEAKRAQIKEHYSKMTVENGGEMVTHTCSFGEDVYVCSKLAGPESPKASMIECKSGRDDRI